MSFSSEVKKELATLDVDKCCLRAELHQIIRLKAEISLDNKNFKLTFTTTNLKIARRIVYLIKNIYNINVLMLKKDRLDLDRKSLYYLVIEENGLNILKDLKLIDDHFNFLTDLNLEFLKKDCCRSAVVRASFLMKGSVNDPRTSNYHLEITFNDYFEATQIQSIIDTVGIDSKIINRSRGSVLYIKKAENIGDFLGFIGATNSRFTFEDFRIKKDLSNYVNRIMNCDVANEQKAMDVAKRQLEDIEIIEKHLGFLNISPRLMNAILLRTTYPEDSLAQLSEKSVELVGKYISKSGLSHCFKDISEIASKIKK